MTQLGTFMRFLLETWFAVGVLWKDRAIMVVHVGAIISLLIGYLNAG